ncbi:MAG: hypothetical protein M3323_00585 [Actinomycetota bacterium]|nr:hypothetical protein [Actinomycetota bacterium]
MAPAVTGVFDRPDPFSPNGDGKKDKARIGWTVSEDIPYVFVGIYKNSRLIRSSGEGTLEPGSWYVKWAGRNDAGAKVSNGTYTYLIHVEDVAGNIKEVTGLTTVRR